MKIETTRERLWEIRSTEKAILFSTMPPGDASAREVWIPRSTIHHVSRDPALPNGWRPCHVDVEAWMAEACGL